MLLTIWSISLKNQKANHFPAFFTFLRANLVLPSSTQNSTISTPLLDASSSQTLPALGPSSLATMTTIDSCSSSSSEESLYPPSFTLEHPRLSDEVPSLTTTTLHYEDDKVAALKLIADSIAQQRQAASTAVIFHPLVVGAYLLLLCVLCQVLWKTRSDLGVVFTTAAGVTMACLVGVRALTNEYLILAEGINWGYLDNGEEDDLLIGSIFGDEIIGVAVLRLERNGNKKRKMGGKGFVRAWTTKLKYRGKGVATGLLEEVVRVTREKVGNSAEIGFAVEHANSRMVLPEMFNKAFRRNEYRAARALDGVIAEVGIHGKKKR